MEIGWIDLLADLKLVDNGEYKMCKINPKVDFAFKKLFGSEENKDLLISLINAVIPKEERIIELELKNPYNLADYNKGKMSILDIKARDCTGRWVNVEMQIGEDYDFDKRAIFYWSKLVTEQLCEGMMFRELKKTISINILDYNFVPDDSIYHNCYKIINTRTLEDDNLHDIFELYYIELKKFKKQFHELGSALDRWATFLTRAHELDKNKIPKALSKDKEIIKAIHAVDRMFDEDERTVYQVRMEAFAEVNRKIASANKKGIEQGIKQGIEQGIKQGIDQKKIEYKKDKYKIIKNMHQAGSSIDFINQVTGLTIAEIEVILQKYEQ